MNQEFESPSQEESEWQAPTSEKEKDEFGAMAKIVQFLQKLPGGKFLLPMSTIISMWGGSIKESGADAREYLKYKNGVTMIMPIVLAHEFGAGVKRNPDGSYVVESKEKLPAGDTLIGDLIYQSGQEINLPPNPEEVIKEDLADFKKELGQTCKDKKLANVLEGKVNGFAREIFPNGYNDKGYLNVERLDNSGLVKKTALPVQWAKFQEVELVVSEHMGAIREQIYHSIKDSSRAKVTDIVLREHGDLVEKAALFNMARDASK